MAIVKHDLLSFNKFFADYQQRFIRFALTYTHDEDIAEDIVSESMMYYWENKERLPQETNLPAYVLTTIKHKCLNYLRHIQLKEDVLNELASHSEWELSIRIATLEACEPNELFDNEVRSIVEQILSKLPEKTSRVFVMSRNENKSYKEIATIMNMSTKGVEFHIAKVMRILRIALKDYLLLHLYLFYLLINH
ncbi:MAG: putative polymerase ECF-type sigma factor [Bacteroidetes bacterium]|jgi:RNA polymerase sigma-70 factor, ECF subfamily|nr:putative polymerase ECF-type sigma factor [Bacteroidota bacterium]